MNIENYMNNWIQELKDDTNKQKDQSNDKFNIMYEVWNPKVSWFQPPLWKIFRWAYNIKRTLLVDCYPISSNSNQNKTVHEIKFTANVCSNSSIDEMANKLLNNMEVKK